MKNIIVILSVVNLSNCASLDTQLIETEWRICASVSSVSLVQIVAFAWSAPSHYLNHRRNDLQWNFNQNSYIFIEENAFEKVVCKMAAILSRPHGNNRCHLLHQGIIWWSFREGERFAGHLVSTGARSPTMRVNNLDRHPPGSNGNRLGTRWYDIF